MKTEPFLEAARELRGRFFSLIDSLSALRGLASIEVRHRPEAELIRGALDVLLRHQDLERCSIFLVEGEELVCCAGLDWDDLFGRAASVGPAARISKRFALGEGIMGEAASGRSLVHCRDCSRDVRFKAANGVTRGSASPSSGALISAPVTARDEVLGVVNVYHPRANHFESWHEHTLSLFCQVLGHMLDNNRLLRTMEQAVEDRTRQLEAALREAEQLKRRYEQLSNIDELTSLHNRRFFFPEAEAVVGRSLRYGHAFSLLLLDVDKFKQVNDLHGHAAGDRVLQDVAAVLKERTREVDILARFGGEEFVVALPSTGFDGARPLADRIREAVRAIEWVDDDGTGFSITVSAGLASIGERKGASRETLELLLREADQAMYHAKALGRDRVVTYDDIPRDD